MPRARGILLLVLSALAALAVLPGCGGTELRYDTVPGPISTADLAMAAADEREPLSDDEWQTLDALHDRYLADFDALRTEVLVPLVREARAVPGADVERDAAAMARLAKRHASALGRIASLDDRFAADLSDALRAHPGLATRVDDRRTIARSARVIEGLGNGDDRSPTILDLEPSIRALGLDEAQQAAAEPALAAYRHELARAARQLAEATIEFPAAWLAARNSANLGDQRMADLKAHAGDGDEQKQALDRANAEFMELLRRTGRPRARGYAAIDDANRRLVAALQEALPPAVAARIQDADVRRRSSGEPVLDGIRLALDAYAAHPDVRAGKAPRTARAMVAVRAAFDAMLLLRIEAQRAAIESGTAEQPAADGGRADRLKAASDKASKAGEAMKAAIREELPDGMLETLEALATYTPDEARERLAPVLGAGTADRLVRSCGRAAFRSEREQRDPEWNKDFSIAEQLLLAPGMDHAAFRRAARAIGAKDDDPLVEQVWERHEARVADLLVRQREQMRALEAKSMQAARNAQADAGAFERSLGDYLQSLLAADGERRAADDETFHEVAIAIGVKDDDARFVLARAVGTARRASLPLRRFRQPWLLGALWEADADPISAALDLPEEMPRTASLVVLSAHADGLRIAADDARHAGLEALRDFLLFGARMQRTGNAGSAESFRDAPEVRGIAARVQATGKARRRAERQAIASIAAMDPELGEHFMLVWERATFPEFFADGRAWRDASDLAAAGIPEIRSDSGAARAAAALERWRMADQDMVRRLSEWQDARTAIAAPASPAELAVAAAQDAELGALRTLRDESAWRLLRQVAVAQGRSPDALMRDDPRMGSLQRPAQWAP